MIDRRGALKSSVLSAAAAVAGIQVARGAQGTEMNKPAIVLVHGAWHGAWAWSELVPQLARAGYASMAFDLPGAGTRALLPKSFQKRPLDGVAFGEEPSPAASITQDQRTAATIEVVRYAASLGHGKVVLVGHSWGGLTISHVAEAVPQLVQSVVYLSAFLLPNGAVAATMTTNPAFADSMIRSLQRADPRKVGAMRIDPRTEDPEARAAMKQAFYGDLSDDRFEAISNLLHPDEVASTAAFPMAISSARYGSVERHYIGMDADRAVPPTAQIEMIKNLDDSQIGGKTTVHRMSGSHSPFFSKPDALSELIVKITG
jgi:pimeloyl-ACP methyl ester carboxylesterase